MDLSRERPKLLRWIVVVGGVFGALLGALAWIQEAPDLQPKEQESLRQVWKAVLAGWPQWAWYALILALATLCFLCVSHRFGMQAWSQVQDFKEKYEATPEVQAWRSLHVPPRSALGLSMTAAEVLRHCAAEISAGRSYGNLLDVVSQRIAVDRRAFELVFDQCLEDWKVLKLVDVERKQELGDDGEALRYLVFSFTATGSAVLRVAGYEAAVGLDN